MKATSIKREDVESGWIDFAEVVTGKKLRAIHPGEILRDEFLDPMKISVYTRWRTPSRCPDRRAKRATR